MKCPICSSGMSNCFQAKVLGKYQAQYQVCNQCKFLRADNPHWLHESYARAIANADTGIIMRNFVLSNKIARVLYWLTKEKGSAQYLDMAGGFGIFTRMMRDIGFDFYWADKYCENLIAPSFEYSSETDQISVATAIEVFEHLTDPITFIKEAFDKVGINMLIFTTELYSGEPPAPSDWWYYSFATGQHIGFFQRKTLSKIADDLNLNFYTANGLHIFSTQPINQFFFKILTNPYLSLFFPFLIRKKLGSKTIKDHQKMMAIIQSSE